MVASPIPVDPPDIVALRRENAQLRAYLRAFVRATIDPDEPPGRDVEVHLSNPSVTYYFGLTPDGFLPSRAMTGGQVLRAMQLVGEAPDLTPAEEAKNLRAEALLRGVCSTLREMIGVVERCGPTEYILAYARNVLSGTAREMNDSAEVARLIALSPDMLAELRRDLTFAKSVTRYLAAIGDTGDVLHTSAESRISSLAALVAKAEGRR